MSTASHLSSTTVLRDAADERRERRYPAPAGVKLSLQTPPDAVVEEAELCDISLSGLGIATARYIEPGISVVLRMGTQRIEAEVRHCSTGERGYLAGVLVRRAISERASRGGRDWETLLVRSRRSAASA